VRLGRDKDNAIVVADQKVSRHHAVLKPLDNTFIITDQGSANGTYLNGVQIAQPTRLKHQDRLTLGDTTFLFTIGQPELTTLEPAMLPLASPLSISQPAALPTAGQNNRLLLGVLSCMALLILFLLLALALLLGLIVGSSSMLG
jgi:pSer/pThr/pTyr-binding forkhead associated (FHA) protein